MMRRVHDSVCVFRIHLARLRAEAGPFLLSAILFPAVMYLFSVAIASVDSGVPATSTMRLHFLAGSIVCSLSMMAISWLGYLLLENRFTGRLKLFATLPLAPSSYILGVVAFGIAQAAAGTTILVVVARLYGVHTALDGAGVALLALVVLLTVLSVCGISVIIAARARSMSAGSLMTDALGAGLVFLAPVYYSPEALPRVLQVVSRVMPTTYAAQGVQALLAGQVHIGSDLAALAALAMVTLGSGFRVMGWREE